MRRILLSAGLIFAATLAPLSAGYAQLTFGGFAGVNFSNLDISALDPNESTSSRTGGMLGGYLGTHLGRLFTVRLEGYWTRKGADLQESGSSVIYAGPAISFKTSCTAEDSSISASCEDVGVMIKSTDFSGIIGAGIGVGPITIDVQYDRSFSGILDEDGASEVKNETWTVRAAFGI